MKHLLLKSLAIATVMFAASSCSTSHTNLPYFVDLNKTVEGNLPYDPVTPIIQPDDELFITVVSSTPEVAAQYNLPANNPATRGMIVEYTSPRQLTYIVDSKGDINFPVLGMIHVAGLTVEQLQEMLTQRISADVQDPVVRVEMVNFRVSVGGEVAKPGVQTVKTTRYSVLDAISEAGDLTPYGERDNVLVVREENGKRTYGHLNLNSSEIFSSPYFYLKQNDYVYIEPNKVRQSNAKYNQDNAFKLQVISTIVSATSVVASLIIALAVK